MIFTSPYFQIPTEFQEILINLDGQMEKWIELANEKDEQLSLKEVELKEERAKVNRVTEKLESELSRGQVSCVL